MQQLINTIECVFLFLNFHFQWAKGHLTILQDLQCKRQPNIHFKRIWITSFGVINSMNCENLSCISDWQIKSTQLGSTINDFAHFKRDSIKRKRRQPRINQKYSFAEEGDTLTLPYTMHHQIISSLALILVAFVHTSKSNVIVYSQMSSQVSYRSPGQDW